MRLCLSSRLSSFLLLAALVLVLPAVSAAQANFLHRADSSNTFLHVTQLDDASVNGDPSARLIVTQLWNPDGGIAGVSNPNPIGVFYSSGRWNILNENLAAMPDGAAFNVYVAPASRSFVHEVSTTSQVTVIDDPLLGGADTQFLVTHNRTPDGQAAGPFVTEYFLSRRFFNPQERWSIEVSAGQALPSGAEFNVFVPDGSFPNFDHRTEITNISFDVTRLDHPQLNGNPSARVWIYQHIQVGPSEINDHPMAVAYDPTLQRWVILNLDGADFVEDVRFVVGYLASAEIFSDGFESGNVSAWSSTVP